MNSTAAPTATNGVISGQIIDEQGNPVAGAVVRLQGTQNRKFITDANGFYRFDNVETNGFYTVTPSRANYSFSPAERSFSQVGQSYRSNLRRHCGEQWPGQSFRHAGVLRAAALP